MPDSGPATDSGALVERARKGDHEAFEALVRGHQEVAFRTAFLITRSAADAEEVVEDAFVKAYRALPRFRADAPFRPWMLRIVANESRNRRRSVGRRPEPHGTTKPDDGGLSGLREPIDSDALPSEQVLAADRRRALLAAVERLEEDDRLVIAFRYFFYLPDDEMSEALDIPKDTIESRLSRAMGRLRQRVQGPN